MADTDNTIFARLYREAYLRCFKHVLAQPLTETEAKIFHQQILEHTGLTVGWRSLKNYSFFVLDSNRVENPSVASMDTLARYVLQAPYTNDIARKNDESHHPYWFMYRKRSLAPAGSAKPTSSRMLLLGAVIVLVIVIGVFTIWHYKKSNININENFSHPDDKSLKNNGWQVLNIDTAYWARRGIQANTLTLFTLPGDNWPDSNATPVIKNLLIHDLPDECFTAELQMRDFIPKGEWQQAGLLLLQDTTFNSPSVRISLAFNDMFGGYNRSKEVLVQAIVSPEHGGKPEEFVHATLLALDSTAANPKLLTNLKQTALRIEKQNKRYRFLYAGGAVANAAFKELAIKEFAFQPHYIALFAIKGHIDATPVERVSIKRFILKTANCD
jgi:hypothetical protein